MKITVLKVLEAKPHVPLGISVVGESLPKLYVPQLSTVQLRLIYISNVMMEHIVLQDQLTQLIVQKDTLLLGILIIKIYRMDVNNVTLGTMQYQKENSNAGCVKLVMYVWEELLNNSQNQEKLTEDTSVLKDSTALRDLLIQFLVQLVPTMI